MKKQWLQSRFISLCFVMGLVTIGLFSYAVAAEAGFNHSDTTDWSGFVASSSSDWVLTGVKVDHFCASNDDTQGGSFYMTINPNGSAVVATSSVYDMDDLDWFATPTDCATTSSYVFDFGEPLHLTGGLTYNFSIRVTADAVEYMYDGHDALWPSYAFSGCTGLTCTPHGYYSGQMTAGSYNILSGAMSLEILFPEDDYIVNDDIENDWEVWYLLPAESIAGYDYIIFMVNDHDEIGNTVTDYDMLAPSTEVGSAIIEMTQPLTQGEHQSFAYAWGGYGVIADCDTWDEFAANPNCTMDDDPIVISEPVVWTASSSYPYGKLDKDYPFGWPGLDYEAKYGTTTGDAATGKDIIDRLINVFPISILNQLRSALQDVYDTEATGISVDMRSLVDSELYPQVASGTILLSADLIEDNFPLWNTHIYPTMEAIVYIIATIMIIIIIFPSFGELVGLLGRRQESDMPKRIRYVDKGQVPVINLRK